MIIMLIREVSQRDWDKVYLVDLILTKILYFATMESENLQNISQVESQSKVTRVSNTRSSRKTYIVVRPSFLYVNIYQGAISAQLLSQVASLAIPPTDLVSLHPFPIAPPTTSLNYLSFSLELHPWKVALQKMIQEPNESIKELRLAWSQSLLLSST